MKTTCIILMLLSLLSCKKDEEISVSANKNIAGEMAGHYEYLLKSFDKEIHVDWDIYRLSDSIISVKSEFSWVTYPGQTTMRSDSIPSIKLTEANKVVFTHQNNEFKSTLQPGGYILTSSGELKGQELTVNLRYSYDKTNGVEHLVKLQKR